MRQMPAGHVRLNQQQPSGPKMYEGRAGEKQENSKDAGDDENCYCGLQNTVTSRDPGELRESFAQFAVGGS
jgi:hypothetical protein